MADNSLSANTPADDKLQALLNNTEAARAISRAVEGTIGPRGLDIMMVDRFGDVVITNDGVTVLKLMEANHPAARLIINAARAQQAEVGDGTTTATIIAGALVAEGSAQILKGVPVIRVLDGIQIGINAAIKFIKERTRQLSSIEDKLLFDTAAIAGRGHQDLAHLVIEGAQLIGMAQMQNPDYKFADSIVARELASNQVFNGVIINREPLNIEMPNYIEQSNILVIDDALRPEDIDHEAMRTEHGFQYYLKAREIYERNLLKICDIGVNVVIADRGIDDIAEEIFTEAGIMAIQKVSSREIEKLCRHTGAKKLKRNSLNRDAGLLKTYLGKADKIKVDEKLEHTSIYGGKGESHAVLIIGAATEEVVDERERVARDAASAVQAALQGGIIPGGGATEVWVGSQLDKLARQQEGMLSFGVLCVREALIRPFSCMVANAGFNPLEKIGDVAAAQRREQLDLISINCENGKLIDVFENGIVDPALVKIQAVKAAGEVATAILRINTIIKMADTKGASNNTME
ncbi:MAG: TCP-1/cpn60 chaperonin family protein [Syntrophomonadaceae bacterium]|nr:TCP-1/cpn60 chaperonin family protein [Syntrophomonadaceae bacterium]MDD3890309.1 TCP-1/cpn60 chaperonin family protein [Syntrophomonadaceae bacterium]MDD4549475.1 TCP-1/cpn60 chaperonin family protein [Syntrophomonadaceae bacterium]